MTWYTIILNFIGVNVAKIGRLVPDLFWLRVQGFGGSIIGLTLILFPFTAEYIGLFLLVYGSIYAIKQLFFKGNKN